MRNSSTIVYGHCRQFAPYLSEGAVLSGSDCMSLHVYGGSLGLYSVCCSQELYRSTVFQQNVSAYA